MACCGRGKSKSHVTVHRAETPPATATPKSPPPVAQPVARQLSPGQQTPPPIVQNVFSPQARNVTSKAEMPVAQADPDQEPLPKCRYREFRSKQIIGGREIETYFCKAFSMSVRQEHCRACQKHDK